MPTVKLTDKGLRSLPLPATGQTDFFDVLLPAFGVRLSKGGTATFFVTSRIAGTDNKLVRITVGRWSKDKRADDEQDPGLMLGEAREKARAMMDQAKRGIDPRTVRQEQIAENRRKASMTFRKVAEEFMTRHAAHLRPNTVSAYRVVFDKTAAEWHERPLSSITPRDAMELLDAVDARGHLIAADRMHAVMRKFFGWALSRDYLKASPWANIHRPVHTVARDRILSDEEIRLFMKATDRMGFPSGPFLKLLLLTGQRRSEVSGLAWSELDLRNEEDPSWLIPRSRAKNNLSHRVPLTPSVVKILASLPKVLNGDNKAEYVFSSNGVSPISGFSKLKVALDRAMLVEVPFTLHDLRRTAASGMARLGVPIHVIEQIMNHRSGTISGIVATYNRHDYQAEMREGLEVWSSKVGALA